jgi:natural product biosynthesis luciferase-like monooxygenase protein
MPAPQLDFALFQLPTYRDGFSRTLSAFYAELTNSVKFADRLGWRRVIVSEHHFHYYGGPVPNPAIILTAWARETARIRVAAGVSLVPLRHPLQVAEDYALLDQLAGGRFDMGVSRGFVPHEFEAFGVDAKETSDRVIEALQIIEKFWAGEPFEFAGRFTSFKKLAPWPVPFQRKIPIWIAASNEIPSFERIGRGGYGLLMNQYPMTFEVLCEKHEAFKAAYARAGHGSTERRSSVALMTHLADNEEQAIEEAKLALQEHVTALRKVQMHREWDRDYQGDILVLLELCASGDYREVFRQRTLIGTPEQAAERLSRYVREGFGEAMFLCRFGNISASQCDDTIERLSKQVRPMLQPGEAKQA